MIELQNVSFGYRKKQKLFDNLSLSIKPGSIYGLLGKNGAGKTTLLKILAGLCYPKEGKSIVSGKTATDRLPSMYEDLYFIPEEIYLPKLSIPAYLKLYAPFWPKFDTSQFEKILEEFEVDKNQNLKSLSFGQKKKFLVAFALATNTRIIIFDEPTNGLDIPSKSQFRKTVASQLTDERIFIISTHQVRDLDSLIDHLIVLDSGRITFKQSIFDISSRLAFRMLSEQASSDSILYAEQALGRKHAIVHNIDEADTKVDFELLFNAITSDPSLFEPIFNSQSNSANS
ncbi:MAG: ABC transporter ATP-binding protein [Bacteroidota bacterium]|nr:ABC transporter ATP-binding protein [Bacteroidota bacterium]